MVIKQILTNANLKCDDNIAANVLLVYLNQGISRLNLECNLKLELIKPEQVPLELLVSDVDFINEVVGNLLTAFVAYCVKQNDGYSNSENSFYTEYVSLKMQFMAKFTHLIKPEYRLTPTENGAVQHKYGPRVNFGKIKL